MICTVRAIEGVLANLFLYISIAITITLETKLQAWFHIGPCTLDCVCFNLTDSEGLWRMTFSKMLCDAEAERKGPFAQPYNGKVVCVILLH